MGRHAGMWKKRRRGEILRTGRTPLEKASASGFTSVLDIHAHFLRGSCHFFSPPLEREGNLIFKTTNVRANVRPAATTTCSNTHPYACAVYRWFVYLSVVIGKVAKQVRQRWKGYACWCWSIMNIDSWEIRVRTTWKEIYLVSAFIIRLVFLWVTVMYVWNNEGKGNLSWEKKKNFGIFVNFSSSL